MSDSEESEQPLLSHGWSNQGDYKSTEQREDSVPKDQEHVPVTTTQPVSSGSLLTDLNMAFTSFNQRICQKVHGCCSTCYDCLFIKPCEWCTNCYTSCCNGITDCFKNCYKGIQDTIHKNRFWINCLWFLFCPCLALFLALSQWKDNSEACKIWYCGCCYDEDNTDQDETQDNQL